LAKPWRPGLPISTVEVGDLQDGGRPRMGFEPAGFLRNPTARE